ncbi:hypothetical protein CGLO_13449 [Colletotrichum gloeosporioides Cg-14]|uniref:Uncharacterized protein n=1 Tax=Colletotrichum gloeosporioides (strain Cg-14) TaxID=1237896 RepID=T0K3N9_COLGC|nr:hypothetical protein CGLO_13449 [Colletotrichum gloeosporioides Cg-14]
MIFGKKLMLMIHDTNPAL